MLEPLTSTESFVAQPFVCGALGEDDRDLFPRLVTAAPVPVRVLQDGTGVRFASSRSAGLERVRGGWTWGRYVAHSRRPKDACEAREEIGLAGLWLDRQGTTLHTDWLGTHDVYTRTVGGTMYWANRIAPLASFVDEPLHVDIEAWRTFLVLSGFTSDATPFAEIRRLKAGQWLRHERGKVRCDSRLPTWFTHPSESATVEDLADAIEAAVPPPRSTAPDLPLSGGLDSRLLLAALLRRGGHKPVTWTTPHESGWDGDVRVATEVAHEAGVAHHVVDYQIADWSSAREPTLDRLEHATSMHNWMLPLAKTIHRGARRHTPLIDGLAGDVLLRYHASIPSDDREGLLRRTWDSLGAKDFRNAKVLRGEVRKVWESSTYAWWAGEMQPWLEHPFPESVVRLLTRTRRAIAASPFRLLAPERRVLTPFIDPSVARVALAVAPLTNGERDLRPSLLRVLNPSLAIIPSTVDREVNRREQTERGPLSEAGVTSMILAIRAEPSVSHLFDAAELDGASQHVGPASTPARIRRAAVLAHWIGRWRPHLAEIPSFD